MIIDDEGIGRVIGLIRAQPGYEHAELDGPAEPISGGFWATLRLLRLKNVDGPGEDLVLRVMPDAALARKEATFQREVSRQGFPVPPVRLFGGPESGVGGALIVMDRAPGKPPLEGLDPLAALRRLPYLARGLPDLLARVSARLHQLDPRPLQAALDETVPAAPTSPSQFLAHLADATPASGRTDLSAACRWLSENQPPASRAAICHGDLHPFNLLVEDDRWTLLDWTTGLIADPGYDLAFTRMMLRHPPMTAPFPLSRFIDLAGVVLSRRFLVAYRRAGGQVPVPQVLDWFTSLHALRALIEVEWWKKDGTLATRGGHPWMVIGPAAARAVSRITGVGVAWRPH